ncbi:MAG: FtsX-like permease family protein [candidate division Zixibacteria bacterium]|nr:FtsX-like permease family protein [candidate division Zixibacteria bacterium]
MNFIRIAMRSIIRQKGYSVISIFGLGLGMAVCILILLWVQYQFDVDRFHENIDEIYWVPTYYQLGNEITNAIGSPPAVGPALKTDYPEIIRASRYLRMGGLIRYGDLHFREEYKMVDPDFLEIFTFPLVKGDVTTALNDPNSIVISESKSKKYFGDEDPIGKTLTIDNAHDLIVTGVLRDLPENSIFGFGFLVPIVKTRDIIGKEYIDTWYNCAFYNIVQLEKNADYLAVSEKIRGRIKQSDPTSNLESYLFPYSKLTLYSISGEGGFIETVRFFIIIALLILLIAIINFVNLMTARSGRRAKEIGIKKVVGANRPQLIRQFYGEALLHSALATIIAIVIVELLLPVFKTLMGQDLTIEYFNNSHVVIGITVVTILTGILAGSYPALLLSSFKPINSLKESNRLDTGKSWFRKILVVTQFAVSIFLIICTIVIYKQHNHMRSIDIGYEKDQLIYLPINETLKPKYDAMKTEMLGDPNIQHVTKSTHSPSGIYWNGEGWHWEGRDDNTDPMVTYLGVGYDYLETFKMEMADGEYYSPEMYSNRSDMVVINEAFAEVMNIEPIVGATLSKNSKNYTVLGVVKDFHFKPVYQQVEPLIMYLEPDNRGWYIFAKIHTQDVENTIAHIETLWNKYCPDFPFEYTFLDEDFENLYYSVKSTGDILKYFSIIAIVISCMGLFGLACFMAERRTKEVGIRKVLGASVGSIIKLLSKEFFTLVVIANIIAAPVAYYLMNSWLQDYVYRISISWLIFAATVLLSLTVALITVSFQAVKAAIADPVKALRYE